MDSDHACNYFNRIGLGENWANQIMHKAGLDERIVVGI